MFGDRCNGLRLRFVLSRGPVGEVEQEACYEGDEEGCNKSGGKAERSDVMVVQEGQQNRGDHGEGQP